MGLLVSWIVVVEDEEESMGAQIVFDERLQRGKIKRLVAGASRWKSFFIANR